MITMDVMARKPRKSKKTKIESNAQIELEEKGRMVGAIFDHFKGSMKELATETNRAENELWGIVSGYHAALDAKLENDKQERKNIFNFLEDLGNELEAGRKRVESIPSTPSDLARTDHVTLETTVDAPVEARLGDRSFIIQ